MKSVATIKLKIPNNKLLLETMRQYSQSAQYVLDIGWNNAVWNKKQLHDMTYYPVREILQLPAQLVCSSRDKACETLKAVRKVKGAAKPQFKEFLTIRYDARSFSFKHAPQQYYVSLVTVNSRVKIPVGIPEYYWKYLDWDVRNADLVFDRKKRMFLHITFSRDIKSCIENRKVVGVDLGINNLAATSDSKIFQAPKTRLKQFYYLRKKLQAKGTKSAKRRLKALSGRQKRFMAWINHNVSRNIVSNADVIVLENLKGIRKNRKSRRFNRWLNNWAFYQLQNFIRYKAERDGKRVVFREAFNTSKMCSECGSLNTSRYGEFFYCLHCGLTLHADLNASFNLRRLHVTQPNISNCDGKTSTGGPSLNSGINLQPSAESPV